MAYQRHPDDYYMTPKWAVDALYNTIPQMPLPTLDPCAGTGALIRAAPPSTLLVGIEIDEGRVAEAADSRVLQGDGLAYSWADQHILMNPPFKDAMTWVKKAQEAKSAAVLLRNSFLGSIKRFDFWQEHPPACLLFLSKRPSFIPKGGTDNSEYMWAIWGVETPRTLYWSKGD